MATAAKLKRRLSSYMVIPARLASTRLPRKLLLRETGKTLLEHTYHAAFGPRTRSACEWRPIMRKSRPRCGLLAARSA